MPKVCKRCEKSFPFVARVNGKVRNLNSRKFCLECSPFGQHNTRNLTASPDRQQRRKSVAQAVASWRQRTKQKAVALLGGRCQACGYDKCVSALTFHHVDPEEKDFTVSGMSVSWHRIQQELKKCVLLCANCHAEVHAGVVPAQSQTHSVPG